MLLKLQPSII